MYVYMYTNLFTCSYTINQNLIKSLLHLIWNSHIILGSQFFQLDWTNLHSIIPTSSTGKKFGCKWVLDGPIDKLKEWLVVEEYMQVIEKIV